MDLLKLVEKLRSNNTEQDWVAFKDHPLEPSDLGEYVSALSNAAVLHKEKYGFLIWGIDKKSHEVIGIHDDLFDPSCKEYCLDFLAENLSPGLDLSFKELSLEGKRVVVLVIPASRMVPVSFQRKRFIQIGSSKYDLHLYPKIEIELFEILNPFYETILIKASSYQNLSFEKLQSFYKSKGIPLPEPFETSLCLRNNEGQYNLLAQLLSDNSHLSLPLFLFEGKNKESNLLSVKEFGYTCLLDSLHDLLDYGKIFNLSHHEQAFREAIINALLHNSWIEEQGPEISVFCDHIEIVSQGSLSRLLSKEGFFSGESVAVNPKLSEIFIQLHISEKAGIGVPVITSICGKEAFTFGEDSIVVHIPLP